MGFDDNSINQLGDSVLPENRITQHVIESLSRPKFATIHNETVSDYIFQYCRQLLKFSMEKHESKEVAYAINLETLDFIGVAVGSSRTVDVEGLIIKMEDSDSLFIVLHNHPSNSTFSSKDLNTFVEASNIQILVVIGNRGSVYVLEKTQRISGEDFVRVKKAVIDYRNGQSSFLETVDMLSAYGIVYSNC